MAEGTDPIANKNARAELIKHGVDTSKLSISCTKGIVEIRGTLIFTGRGSEGTNIESLTERIKTLERIIRSISYERGVVWRLDNWQKLGARWAPTKVFQKQIEKQSK